jgi:hypothetical protein
MLSVGFQLVNFAVLASVFAAQAGLETFTGKSTEQILARSHHTPHFNLD